MTVQTESLASDKEFTRLASDEQIERTVKALEENLIINSRIHVGHIFAALPQPRALHSRGGALGLGTGL